jgi:hypothetical protein
MIIMYGIGVYGDSIRRAILAGLSNSLDEYEYDENGKLRSAAATNILSEFKAIQDNYQSRATIIFGLINPLLSSSYTPRNDLPTQNEAEQFVQGIIEGSNDAGFDNIVAIDSVMSVGAEMAFNSRITTTSSSSSSFPSSSSSSSSFSSPRSSAASLLSSSSIYSRQSEDLAQKKRLLVDKARSLIIEHFGRNKADYEQELQTLQEFENKTICEETICELEKYIENLGLCSDFTTYLTPTG